MIREFFPFPSGEPKDKATLQKIINELKKIVSKYCEGDVKDILIKELNSIESFEELEDFAERNPDLFKEEEKRRIRKEWGVVGSLPRINKGPNADLKTFRRHQLAIARAFKKMYNVGKEGPPTVISCPIHHIPLLWNPRKKKYWCKKCLKYYTLEEVKKIEIKELWNEIKPELRVNTRLPPYQNVSQQRCPECGEYLIWFPKKGKFWCNKCHKSYTLESLKKIVEKKQKKESEITNKELMKNYGIDIIRPETKEEQERRISKSKSYFLGPSTPGKLPKPSFAERIRKKYIEHKLRKMPREKDIIELEEEFNNLISSTPSLNVYRQDIDYYLNEARKGLQGGDINKVIADYKEAKGIIKILSKGRKSTLANRIKPKIKEIPDKRLSSEWWERIIGLAGIIVGIVMIHYSMLFLGIPFFVIGLYLLLMNAFTLRQEMGIICIVVGSLLFIFAEIRYTILLVIIGALLASWEVIEERFNGSIGNIIKMMVYLIFIISIVYLTPAFLTWAGIEFSAKAFAFLGIINTLLLAILWEITSGKSTKEALEIEYLKEKIGEVELSKKLEKAKLIKEKISKIGEDKRKNNKDTNGNTQEEDNNQSDENPTEP